MLQPTIQKTNKRNNSSDERKNENSGSPKDRRFNSVAKMQTRANNKEDVQSTGGQTLSMFNENKKIVDNNYGEEFDATSNDEEFRDLSRS